MLFNSLLSLKLRQSGIAAGALADGTGTSLDTAGFHRLLFYGTVDPVAAGANSAEIAIEESDDGANWAPAPGSAYASLQDDANGAPVLGPFVINDTTHAAGGDVAVEYRGNKRYVRFKVQSVQGAVNWDVAPHCVLGFPRHG